ncbi:MAG: adenylate/guanylate cyclase domain-containing protein [Anaerolineales bacterium]
MTNPLIFLFTDLEGSTRLWQQFPEAMKTVLARHDEIIKVAVESCDGQVVKTTGDGFHAVFYSIRNCLQACLQAQQNLIEESWGETGPMRVRMGLHIGEAQARAGDYYGTAVNRTARLMSAANGGQVLLSAAAAGIVADQLPDGVSLLDLGEHRLKDLQRPEHIFQLLYPGLPSDFPPISSLNRLPNNLPSQPTVFVGRKEAIGEINKLLVSDAVRLLTLIGPGGTGKTRLALQIGAELVDNFVDGTYFVDLAPIREPDLILATIARVIGVSETSNGSMLEDLKVQLREKTMLLILDNFEQVTSGAVQVAELLSYCPRLKMLATSREALHVRGEHLYPVPPLELPEVDSRHPNMEEIARYEAIQLFVERAQAVRPNFELTDENAEAIAEICLRLDGLPLALELAAARLRLFSPHSLLQRLGSRFKLLKGGARDLPERQQTLRDTIDWSYNLLDSSEKRLFEVVSVFSGSTFESVESVANNIDQLGEIELDIFEGLFSLVDKSLIRMLDDGVGEPRLQMLETIREYAYDRLKEDSGLHDTACRMHATYFAEFAQQQWKRMTGYERDPAIQRMTVDLENLKIAWRYWVSEGDLEKLQQMVNGLWLLYDVNGWYQATVELAIDLLNILSTTASSPEQAQQEIMLQTSLARALMAIKGFTPEVEDAYIRALKLSEGQGEIPQLFPVLRGLSSYYMYQAEFDKGAQIGQRILDLAEKRDDNFFRLHGYLVLGVNIGFTGNFQDGLEILGKGIEIFEREPISLRPYQLGNNPGIVCYTSSAIFLYQLGFLESAVEKAERAMKLATTLNHPYTLAYTLFHTGSLYLWLGEIEQASEQASAMLEVAVEHGFLIWESLATMLIGVTQMAMGQPKEGLVKLEQGFASYQGHKTAPVFYPNIIAMRAGAYAQIGHLNEGLNLLNNILREIGDERALLEQPQLLMLRGDILLAASPESTAEVIDLFKLILTDASRMGLKLLALQAATRLCKLEMLQGNGEASRKVLADIVDSFSEGFEMADLRAARAILGEGST